jgi:hypothetical protein
MHFWGIERAMDLEHPSHINLLIKKATLVNFEMVGSTLGVGARHQV